MTTMYQCPSCGEGVAEGWRYCPYCRTVLIASTAKPPLRPEILPPPAEEEIRGDVGRVGIGLIVLGLLGAIGGVLIAMHGGVRSLRGVVGIIMGSLLTILIGTVIGLTSPRSSTRATAGALGGAGFTGVLGCGLSAIVIALIMPLLMILSLFIALLSICAGVH